jgi:hypothetical protein
MRWSSPSASHSRPDAWPVRRRTLLFTSVLLAFLPAAAWTQGVPVKLVITGSPSATATGKLRCQPGSWNQFSIRGLDADGKETPLTVYAPEAVSSDQNVVKVDNKGSSSILNATCVAVGQAEVGVEFEGVQGKIAVVVGNGKGPVSTLPAPTPTSSGTSPSSPTTAATPPATSTSTSSAPTSTTTTTSTTATPSTTGTTSTTATAPTGAIRTSPATSSGATALTSQMVPPSTVLAAYANSGHIALSWNKVAGATGYFLVYRKPDGTWAGANDFTVGNAGYLDTAGVTRDLSPGNYDVGVISVFDASGVSQSRPSQTISVTVPRWYAHYRVTVNGIKVNRETSDDPLQTDGKHDEVFLRAWVGQFDPAGVAAGTGAAVQTLVHGDVNSVEWLDPNSPTRRVQAGSASARGGLQTGDVFPVNWNATPSTTYRDRLPLLLWEGDLYQGKESVMITPTIWESDQRPGISPTYTSSQITLDRDFVAQLGPQLTRRLGTEVKQASAAEIAAMAAAGDALFPGSLNVTAGVPTFAPAWAVATMIRSGDFQPPPIPQAVTRAIADADADMSLASAKFAQVSTTVGTRLHERATSIVTVYAGLLSGFAQMFGMELNLHDRPIGIQFTPTGFTFKPQTLVLTFENVEGLLASGTSMTGLPAGFVELRYTDGYTGLGGNGDYSLYLQIQRVP